MLNAQPVDLPATLARLDLPEPQQTQMLEKLSEAAAQERAVEAEIDSKIGALSASIAANNTKYLDKSIDIQALPAIDKPITREILEARYAMRPRAAEFTAAGVWICRGLTFTRPICKAVCLKIASSKGPAYHKAIWPAASLSTLAIWAMPSLPMPIFPRP